MFNNLFQHSMIKKYGLNPSNLFGIIFLLLNHLFVFMQIKNVRKLKKQLQLKIDSETSLNKEKLESVNNFRSAEFSRRPKGNYQKRTISFKISLDRALIKACKLKGQSRSLFIEKILLQSKEFNSKEGSNFSNNNNLKVEEFYG